MSTVDTARKTAALDRPAAIARASYTATPCRERTRSGRRDLQTVAESIAARQKTRRNNCRLLYKYMCVVYFVRAQSVRKKQDQRLKLYNGVHDHRIIIIFFKKNTNLAPSSSFNVVDDVIGDDFWAAATLAPTAAVVAAAAAAWRSSKYRRAIFEYQLALNM